VLRKLASIHAQSGIYDEDKLNCIFQNNIINRISGIPELNYLNSFYLEYFKIYRSIAFGHKRNPSDRFLTGVARSMDLPFLGSSVVKNGRAKYMVVFEGSLQKKELLSMTVLSCFWVLGKATLPEDILDIFNAFWPRRRHAYQYIKNSLGITPVIAQEAYVVDAIRIGSQNGTPNKEKNRELLQSEIELFKPQIVVLVGNTASNVIGKGVEETEPQKYIKVPFPTKRRSPKQMLACEKQYQILHARWSI
jgi:hypothetical protein